MSGRRAGSVANIQRAGAPVAGAGPGNGRAVTHGAYSVGRLQRRAEVLAEELLELVPVRGPADAPAVRRLALIEARIEAAHEWLDEHGLVRRSGHPQPVLKALSTWENTAIRLYEQLGLTPASRVRMGLQLTTARDLAMARARAMSRAELEQMLVGRRADGGERG